MSYQWLYYSDFLTSQEAKNAILGGLSARWFAIVAAAMIALIAMAGALQIGLRIILRKFGWRPLVLLAAALSGVYLPTASLLIARSGWNSFELVNPARTRGRTT